MRDNKAMDPSRYWHDISSTAFWRRGYYNHDHIPKIDEDVQSLLFLCFQEATAIETLLQQVELDLPLARALLGLVINPDLDLFK